MARQLFVDPGRMDELRQMLAKDGVVRGAEVEVYRRDRTKKWVLMNLRAVRDTEGNIVLHEGTVEDITDRKAAEERVQYLAYYDALTGLPNRTLLRDRLSKALASARRQKREGCASVSRSRPVQRHQRLARALGRRPSFARRCTNDLRDGPVNKTRWLG